MKRLEYAPQALRDLRSISRYIAKDSPSRAATFVAELMIKAEQAAMRPRSFRSRRDLGPTLRSAVHGNYILFFNDLPDLVRVERVMHGARNLMATTFR